MLPAVGHIEPGSRPCPDAEADSTAAAAVQRTEVAVAADQRIEAAAVAAAAAGTVRHCSKRGLSRSNEAEAA